MKILEVVPKNGTKSKLKTLLKSTERHLRKDVSISGAFTIDPSKTPKNIEFLLANNPEEKFLGVYEIRGERRLSCFALPKQARPRQIRPTEKGFLMFEWKPAAQ